MSQHFSQEKKKGTEQGEEVQIKSLQHWQTQRLIKNLIIFYCLFTIMNLSFI